MSNPEETIYNYLKGQNRPYSASDIFMNLQKKIGKTQVQRSIDSLVEAQKVIQKDFGKSKIYVINQSEFPPIEQEKIVSMQKNNALKDSLIIFKLE